MQIDAIKSYLTSHVKTPYFFFVSDGQYLSAIDELKVCGLDIVPISKFCNDDDKQPDIDGLFDYIEAADMNAIGKKFVVTGLGEFLALRGTDEAKNALSRLKDHNVGGAKVVLLLRGMVALIAELTNDPRFDKRRHCIIDGAECDISITLAASEVTLPSEKGFKAMLVALESGRNGGITVTTNVNLDKSMFTVFHIDNAFDGVKHYANCFSLARSCGNEKQWGELLSELNQSNGSLDSIFEKYGFNESLEFDFYLRAAGEEFHNWLYYICLKCKATMLQNDYLRFVLDKTNRFDEFISSVLNAIIEVSCTDKRFAIFYNERKILVEKFPEPDIASFVLENRRAISESIYKLTDNTRTEREEIIAWISKNGVPKQLDTIYPALAAYLRKYVFKCSDLADLLTNYFEDYKRQKISNQLESEFLQKVDEMATPPRRFNHLKTRDEIINGIDKDGTHLYWLDALGVEYLGLIEALAQKRGLAINISIARAELPTITSFNRGFFDAWQGMKNGNNGDKSLDEVKHKEAGGYNYTKNELPIHLAMEIEIIASIIDKAATELAQRKCNRFLIVSDHGASRLAVLRRKEEKYQTDTIGEHSGRCCKVFQDYDIQFAAEENGYLVLADYGRFKGSRAANVEVHGGASLEEVVVPIIELTLKDNNITVKLIEETVMVDSRAGTEINLFINAPVKDVSLELKGEAHPAAQTNTNHYNVKLPNTKRAGNYLAAVYAGDNLLGTITIKAQGRSGNVSDAFDDLF